MDSEKTPESTLVDHSFVAKPAPTKLWPLALGTCAIFLTVGSVVTGYSHFEGLKAEIKRLSGELVYSRKQVAELIAENAILNKKLATTGSDSTPTPPSPAATGLTGSTSYEDERAGEAFLTDEIGVGGFDRKKPERRVGREIAIGGYLQLTYMKGCWKTPPWMGATSKTKPTIP